MAGLLQWQQTKHTNPEIVMSQLPQFYLLRLWRERAEQPWRVMQNISLAL